MTVKEKLSEIQNKLKVPKNQYNDFGKYYYRNCDDIMEASKPICKELKCVVICTDEIVEKNNRYYVEATAILIDLESDDTISVKASAREEETKKGMDGSQVTGASSSYARKYALNGLFQLDDNKDADTNEFHKQVTRNNKNTKNMITSEQVKKLQTLLSKKDGLKEKIYSQLKIKSCKELTEKRATSVIKQLEGMVSD